MEVSAGNQLSQPSVKQYLRPQEEQGLVEISHAWLAASLEKVVTPDKQLDLQRQNSPMGKLTDYSNWERKLAVRRTYQNVICQFFASSYDTARKPQRAVVCPDSAT